MRRVTVIPFKGRNVKGQVTRPLNAVTENQPYLKSPLAGGGACCSPHSLLITCIIQYYFAPVSPKSGMLIVTLNRPKFEP